MENASLDFSSCDIKFAATDGVFSGYGAVFGNLDSKNDIIMPGAFDDVLKSGDRVDTYVNHGWKRGELPVGSWSDLKQDAKGLFGDSSLVMQMPSAVNAYWAMKSGLVRGLSIGFISDEKTNERKSNGVRVIHRMKALKEISIVTSPANDEAKVMSVKFIDELDEVKTIRDFEYFLRDAGGFSKAAAQSVTAKAKALFGTRDAAEEAESKQRDEILKRIQMLVG